VSWDVPVVIIPFLVFSGRVFVTIAWRLLGCRNALRLVIRWYRIVRWLIWRSVAVWMSLMCRSQFAKGYSFIVQSAQSDFLNA